MIYTTNLEKSILRRAKQLYVRTDSKVNITFGCLLFYAVDKTTKNQFFRFIEHYNQQSGTKIDFYILGITKYNPQGQGASSKLYKSEQLLEAPEGEDISYKYNYNNFREDAEYLGGKIDCDLLDSTDPKLIIFDAEVDLDNERIFYTDWWVLNLKKEIEEGTFDKLFHELCRFAGDLYDTKKMKNASMIKALPGTHTRKIIDHMSDFGRDVVVNTIATGIIEGLKSIHFA
jgi:hypothetical protein